MPWDQVIFKTTDHFINQFFINNTFDKLYRLNIRVFPTNFPTLKGSRRCSCNWACKRSHAAETTGSGSSHLEPHRSSPLRPQSTWPASGPCVWGRTLHQSPKCDCPPVWFSWSKQNKMEDVVQTNSWHTVAAVHSYEMYNLQISTEFRCICCTNPVAQSPLLVIGLSYNLFPNSSCPVKGAGGQDLPEFWMGPGHPPNWPAVCLHRQEEEIWCNQ